MCFYSESLEKMLVTSGVPKKNAYSTGDISQLLSISNSKVIMLCDDWTPPNIRRTTGNGLECYRVGTHRRIPHHAIVEWLISNSNFNKLGK